MYISYASPNDKPLAFSLADTLSLGSAHQIAVQPSVSQLASLKATVMLLFLFSDDGVAQFGDASNVFLDSIQVLQPNMHPVPLLVESNGTAFNVGTVFGCQYPSLEKRESIVNLFKIQGIKISASDVSRSIASIFQTQKQVLGLAVSGNIDPSKQPLTSEEDAALVDFLSPVDELLQNERSRLLKQHLPGTREWLIGDMMEFIEHSSDRLLWLNAQAGAGKSVVSALLADRLQKANLLGSAFFFRHDNQVLCSALALVNSIAYSLSKWSPSYGRRLLSVLRGGDVDFRSSPSSLFDKLLTEPLNELAAVTAIMSPIVLIVDALDECSELSARRDLLELFAQKIKNLPTFVKIIATSRPEPDIVSTFKASGLPQQQIIPSEENNKKDVELVARLLLANMGVPDSVVGSLAILLLEKSGGLFIWMVMALNALKDTNKTLEDVEALPLGLNSMYETTFKRIFHRRSDPILTAVLQLIGVSQEPLSCAQIAEFILVDESKVVSSTNRLNSVLSADSGRMMFVHKSVSDYLTSRDCKDVRFKLDQVAVNQKLFLRLMDIADARLHENMAGVDATINWSPNALSQALPYTVMYWPNHFTNSISRSSREADELISVVQTFCATKLSFYLEAMVLLGKLSDMIEITGVVTSCLDQFAAQGSTNAAFIKAILSDLKFVAFNFRRQLEFSPLQVYAHALIAVPQSTLYYKTYSRFAIAELVVGADLEWGPVSLDFHDNTVFCALPLSRNIVISCGDETIKVLDIDRSECLQTLTGHTAPVCSLALTSDKKRVISKSRDRTIKVWDLTTRECIKTLVDPKDATIQVWNIESGEIIQTLEDHAAVIRGLALSKDGCLLATGSDDKTVKLWSLESASIGEISLINSIEFGIGRINCVAFSPDSRTIMAGSKDTQCTVRTWSLETGEPIATLTGHRRCVNSVAFTPDGKYGIVGAISQIKIWNLETGSCVRTFVDEFKSVTCIRVLEQDGAALKLLTCCTMRINVWALVLDDFVDQDALVDVDPKVATLVDVESVMKLLVGNGIPKEMIEQLASVDGGIKNLMDKLGISGAISPEPIPAAAGSGNSDEDPGRKVFDLRLSRNGKVAISADFESVLKLWYLKSGGNGGSKKLIGHSDHPSSIAISPDSMFAASGSNDKTVRLWDTATGKCIRTFEGHSASVIAVIFHGNAIISGSEDKTIKIWSIESGACLSTLYGHSAALRELSVSEDGKTLVSTSDKIVKLWNLASGACVATFEVDAGKAAVSLDGRTLVVESYGVVQLWNVDGDLSQNFG
ncbi:UNVERIFIED_CONTAM: hypothetical protein HDU68_009458 [Siphonaria sp. JEL0065]|nr:hypothetical protein HDU68_009458 [Siphonaria sp. JEL0065]